MLVEYITRFENNFEAIRLRKLTGNSFTWFVKYQQDWDKTQFGGRPRNSGEILGGFRGKIKIQTDFLVSENLGISFF